MTEMRRGQKGGYDSSTLRLQIMSHNFDYVIFIIIVGWPVMSAMLFFPTTAAVNDDICLHMRYQ